MVAATGLPEDAKRFLSEVGLPHDVGWDLLFGPQGGGLPQLEGHPGYYIIGASRFEEDRRPICLDEARNGRVISIETDSTDLFVNSDVRLFGEFLVLYQKYRHSIGSLDADDEDEHQKAVAETERQMRAVDEPAATRADAWWQLLLEQMNAGFL